MTNNTDTFAPLAPATEDLSAYSLDALEGPEVVLEDLRLRGQSFYTL